MIWPGTLAPLIGAYARAPWLWSGVAGLLLGAWAAYGAGHDAGHDAGMRAGIETGRAAERARQAEAALTGTRDALRDRWEAEHDVEDEMDAVGSDLERLCQADPACRDRYGLRLDESLSLVGPGHGGDGDPGPPAQRGPGQALPEATGDAR